MKKYKYLILSISVLGLIVAFFFFQACTKTEKKANKTEILTDVPLLAAYDFLYHSENTRSIYSRWNSLAPNQI